MSLKHESQTILNKESFGNRLEEVKRSEEIKRGLMTVSRICHEAESVLYDSGIPNVWLPPLDSSIAEYGNVDYTVINPLTNEELSLIQSPQIMKEAVAISFGSNWRRTTCYRPEPGDATHAQMFQQLDVELRGSGDDARGLASEIYRKCVKSETGSDPGVPQEYDYLTLLDLYGTADVNLHHGPYLDLYHNKPVLRLELDKLQQHDTKPLIVEHLHQGMTIIDIKQDEALGLHGRLKAGEIIIGSKLQEQDALIKLRELRQLLFNKYSSNETPGIVAYWLVNMPFANQDDQGKISPTHHVMSMPYEALADPNFSFSRLVPVQLTRLKCNSYDLIACTKNGTVELAGGDQRIHTARLQREVLRCFELPETRYARLLDALEINEKTDYQFSFAGFAFGIERFAMMLAGLEKIDQVQIYPTNHPDGILIHTAGGGKI